MLTLFSVAPAPGGVGAAGGPVAGVLAAEQAAFVHLLDENHCKIKADSSTALVCKQRIPKVAVV
jgi:hypothetical protein